MKKFFAVVLMIMLAAGLYTTDVYAEETKEIQQIEEITQTQEMESPQDDPQYERAMRQRQKGLLKASIDDVSKDYAHNAKFADRIVHNGIDVSYWQGDIDWEKVKQSGVEFVLIRVGYRGVGTGALVPDAKAQEYYKGASGAGLKIGAYVFSQAVTVQEAVEEAQFVMEQVQNWNVTMPLVMDYEYASYTDESGETQPGRLEAAVLTAEQKTDIANAFGEAIRKQGYDPMFYANKSMLSSDMNAKDISYKVWLANYTYETTYTGDYDFWQYCSDGQIDGIKGYVDCNFWYEEVLNGWREVNGKKYWYDNGVMAANKEVCDTATGKWYWFDADGVMAADKDVYLPEKDKWVRYDANGQMIKGEDERFGGWYRFDELTGAMIKGWYTTTDNKTYYYDTATGQMVHGIVTIQDEQYAFDEITGIMADRIWYTVDGVDYWYEGGIRQGMEGRGKEIYDPASDAWYWLDAVQGGAIAVSKDVYQESSGGKWVRYDENGHMVKGWDEKNGNQYYFDEITGAMLKGSVEIDGEWYYFDEVTGILQ